MTNQQKINQSINLIEKAIAALLARYDSSWVDNEGDIDQRLLSECDNVIYESLFHARQILKFSLRVK